jgi:hypothetical protein
MNVRFHALPLQGQDILSQEFSWQSKNAPRGEVQKPH